MQVVLLLTLDPGLEREIEKALAGMQCITIGSAEEASSVAAQLDPPPVLLVDSTLFSPSEHVEIEHVVCLGDQLIPGYPLLERPIRAKELQAVLQLTGSGASKKDSSGSDEFLPSPFAEFQRDAVHDLKNQLTTIMGNLMLMREESKDPAIEDMTDASTKALVFTEWLEKLGAGDFPKQELDLREFLEALLPFFYRLRNRECTFDLDAEPTSIPIHTDQKKLLATLLLMVQTIPGHPQTCQLNLRSTQDGLKIRCQWEETESTTSLQEVDPGWLRELNVHLNTTDTSWELTF